MPTTDPQVIEALPARRDVEIPYHASETGTRITVSGLRRRARCEERAADRRLPGGRLAASGYRKRPLDRECEYA